MIAIIILALVALILIIGIVRYITLPGRYDPRRRR